MSLINSSCLLLASFILCALVALTLGHPGANGLKPMCAGDEIKMVEDAEAMKKTPACMAKFMASDKSAEPKCQMHVCMGQAMGLIDSAGKIVKSNVTAKIDAMFPASKKPDITKAVDDCYAKHEQSLDLTKCSATYDELSKCALTAIGTICDMKDLVAMIFANPGATPAASG